MVCNSNLSGWAADDSSLSIAGAQTLQKHTGPPDLHNPSIFFLIYITVARVISGFLLCSRQSQSSEKTSCHRPWFATSHLPAPPSTVTSNSYLLSLRPDSSSLRLWSSPGSRSHAHLPSQEQPTLVTSGSPPVFLAALAHKYWVKSRSTTHTDSWRSQVLWLVQTL